MIRIHYKPLESLRPIHIALLASLKTPTSSDEIASNLSVPEMLLGHAIDDAVAWSLAARDDNKVALLDNGARCMAVWAETAKRGYWEFDDTAGWRLGKGVFSFRMPIDSIAEAGLDAETGSRLTESGAVERLREFRKNIEYVEHAIEADALRMQLLKSSESCEELVPVIERALSRAMTRLHLNQLCKQADNGLSEIKHLTPENRRQIDKAREFLRNISGIERKIREQDKSSQEVIHVVLAAWLSGRTGILKEIAQSEPAALVFRSDCDDFSWRTEPQASFIEAETPASNSRDDESPSSIVKKWASLWTASKHAKGDTPVAFLKKWLSSLHQ